jgi:hypothetical protein
LNNLKPWLRGSIKLGFLISFNLRLFIYLFTIVSFYSFNPSAIQHNYLIQSSKANKHKLFVLFTKRERTVKFWIHQPIIYELYIVVIDYVSYLGNLIITNRSDISKDLVVLDFRLIDYFSIFMNAISYS